MFRVVVPDCLAPPAALEAGLLDGFAEVACLQARSTAELHGRLTDADGILLYHEVELTADLVAEMKRCRVIVRCGAGYDNIDLQAAGEKGIVVSNVPDYGVDEVADHTMAMLLASARGLPKAERRLRGPLVPWDRAAIEPVPRLGDQTLGIIGCGRIGTAVLERARGFKMRILVCDPYLRPGMNKALGFEWVGLGKLLAESDFVTLHTPLTEETRNLIDREAIGKMRDGSVLVNTSRGAVVDDTALVDALRAGKLGGAGIDVLPDEPPTPEMPLMALWREDSEPPVNLIITPHVAYYSEAALMEMRTRGVAELRRVLEGRPPRQCVNSQWLSPR